MLPAYKNESKYNFELIVNYFVLLFSSMSRHFEIQARGAKKRQRTRGSLLDSAVDVFARKGISNAKISDITEIAGLANGTFYNHFKDKDELALQTTLAIIIEIGAAIDKSMTDIETASLRIVVATTQFLTLATDSKNWGLVLVDGYHQLPKNKTETALYLKAEIQLGLDQHVFETTLDNFLLHQIAALIMSSLSVQLAKGVDAEMTRRTCQHVLQILGMSPATAIESVSLAQVKLAKTAKLAKLRP
ncbi:MAG: AcrR family transcriptional regulator [Oceanicoccus sp.]